MANLGSDNVSVIRTSDNTVVATVAAGDIPNGVAITPDGAFAYVSNAGSSTVSVIRTADNTVVAIVAVPDSPGSVAITPDGAFAYLTNSNLGVTVIRISDNSVVTTVIIPGGPASVAVTPDGAFVYMTNFTADNVSVIRTSDNTVVATVGVGAIPIGVAITPVIQPCTLQALLDDLEALVTAGTLSRAQGQSLSVKLEAALRLVERDDTQAAGNLVRSFLTQVEALVRSGRLFDADAQPLRDQAACVAAQLGV